MMFYTRKMQMVNGLYISTDHCHKVTKCILVQGEKAFEGIYAVMNEYGQVMAWWLVHGTSLNEIKR
jgi:hypothetical protein